MRMPWQPSREDARRAYDQRRTSETVWRKWYWTQRWRTISKTQLTVEPLCRMCMAEDMITPATVCDHVTPHRGNPEMFWNGPFQSLCKPCHDGGKQADEGRLS